jgi:hypothetical protein
MPTKAVTQQFITNMFAKMDDDVHAMIAKPVRQPVAAKPTKKK